MRNVLYEPQIIYNSNILGNNWCSPYIGWQKVYDNSPKKMAGNHGNLILGEKT